MYDLIGDVHGCVNELVELLTLMGYNGDGMAHPNGRKAVFVGDLCDRGPSSDEVLDLVMEMVEEKNAIVVMGNHDNKLCRYLKGNKVTVNNGLQSTLDQLNARSEDFRAHVLEFLLSLHWRAELDNGRLLVVHAAAPERLQGELTGKKKKSARAAAFYGVTTGKTDAEGYPERVDWAESYSGPAIVVHGHVATLSPVVKNNVYNIDTACVYGNKLTALRYPEMKMVSVDANKAYSVGRQTPDKWKVDNNGQGK